EHDAGATGGGHEVLGLRRRVDERLVGDDVDARLGEGLGHGVADVVRRDDHDEVDPLALGPLELALEHRLPRRVVAVVGEPERGARAARLLRGGGERARGELVTVVEGHRVAVHRPDEGALAAADHAVAEAARHDRPPSRPSSAKAASNAVADGAKSSVRQNAADSVAPWTRSMRTSSHSTESGPW